MSKGKQWFLVMVVTAFIAMISFFQINSYYADVHHLNGMWWMLGLGFGAAALYALWKTINNSN